MSKLCFLFLLIGLGGRAIAAPCDSGFLLRQGAVSEMVRYNAGHTPMGKVVSTVVSSVAKGDTVTAVVSVDNYIGNTKASTSTVDYVCDGKNVSLNVRNGNAMKDFYGKAAAEVAKSGQKLLDATNFSEPQVYPLAMKVGDELPPWRTFAMVVIQKAPPDWSVIAASQDWLSALIYALDRKFAGGVQTVTMNIKVVGQETCTLPGGASLPCFHISKSNFNRPIAGKTDIHQDVNKMAKGANLLPINEWFVPGLGVVKLEIGPVGKPLISMVLTVVPALSAQPAVAPTDPASAPTSP